MSITESRTPGDLQTIIAAWAGLSEEMRAGIVAMVRAARKEWVARRSSADYDLGMLHIALCLILFGERRSWRERRRRLCRILRT